MSVDATCVVEESETMFRYKGQTGWTLHSGSHSIVKIALDDFTGEDWAAAAYWGSKLVGPFGNVYDCGGASVTFADALRKYSALRPGPSLVVDDVLTTGKTMEAVHQIALRDGNLEGVKGLVVFARGPLPVWVQAIFTLDERLRGE
jgi:hypothetical protein